MIIFDLDSTLVDARQCTQQLGDWEAYSEALNQCPAYIPMAKLCQEAQEIQKIMVITGRSERLRADVERWLDQNGLSPDELFMRPELNNQPEPELFVTLINRARDQLPFDFMSWLITGRERIAELSREMGIQSLMVTRLVQS